MMPPQSDHELPCLDAPINSHQRRPPVCSLARVPHKLDRCELVKRFPDTNLNIADASNSLFCLFESIRQIRCLVATHRIASGHAHTLFLYNSSASTHRFSTSLAQHADTPPPARAPAFQFTLTTFFSNLPAAPTSLHKIQSLPSPKSRHSRKHKICILQKELSDD
jgi:hypothetical protein